MREEFSHPAVRGSLLRAGQPVVPLPQRCDLRMPRVRGHETRPEPDAVQYGGACHCTPARHRVCSPLTNDASRAQKVWKWMYESGRLPQKETIRDGGPINVPSNKRRQDLDEFDVRVARVQERKSSLPDLDVRRHSLDSHAPISPFKSLKSRGRGRRKRSHRHTLSTTDF